MASGWIVSTILYADIYLIDAHHSTAYTHHSTAIPIIVLPIYCTALCTVYI